MTRLSSNELHCTLLRKTIQAHLANGHLGLQGSDSGLAAARSFMVGISDLTPSDHFRMALLPTWNAVDVRVGDARLEDAFAAGAVHDYCQTLDIGSATLTTRCVVEVGGARVSVETEVWLSRADRFLAVQSIKLKSDRDLTLQIGITQNPAPKRYPWRSILWPHEDFDRQYGEGFSDPRMSNAWHPGHMDVTHVDARPADGAWALSATAAGCGPAVGVAMAIRVDGARIEDYSDASNARATLFAGRSVHLEQFVAFSRDDRPRRLVAAAMDRARSARDAGLPALRAAHDSAWRELWKGDVIIEGNDRLAQQARADLFMLYQNSPVDDRYPIQIMGMASPGYFGGCFWDCDVHALPAVLPFRNELGRSTVLFRKRILPTAMRNAAAEGRKGAKYWVISELVEGNDNNGPHSVLGRNEIHFTADAAIGAWFYYCATGDTSYLRIDGWPVLQAVAEYFASRVEWIEHEGRYELIHVFSAQEAIGLASNCLYTNAAVRKVMRCACRAAEVVGLTPPPIWRSIAEHLHIPTNQKTGLWQANSATEKPEENRWLETNSIFLCDLPASEAQLREIISAKPIHWDMSYQASIAAMAQNPAKMREYLDFQTTNFAHDEYLIRTEMKTNDAGPYITGSACLIMNLLLGAGGLRWTESGLTPLHAPCLPEGVRRIHFPRLEWHERAYEVTIEPRGRTIEPLG